MYVPVADAGGMTGIVMIFALGFALAFAESGLGLGMVVPGETAVVVLAATMHTTTDAVLLLVCVALGASAGDHVGFAVGRHFGDRLRETRVVRKLGRSHYDRAMDVLRHRGAAAIFLTRLVPIVRTLTPAAAGASGLAYRRFAPASLAGSLLWATAYVGGGTAVSSAIEASGSVLGQAAWLLLVVVAVAVVPVLIIRRFVGVRPVAAQKDVASYERAIEARHRRSSFSPLIGDFQA